MYGGARILVAGVLTSLTTAMYTMCLLRPNNRLVASMGVHNRFCDTVSNSKYKNTAEAFGVDPSTLCLILLI